MKDENHTIITRDERKAPDNIQHYCMIKEKPLNKLGMERTYLKINIIKATYEKPTANMILNSE